VRVNLLANLAGVRPEVELWPKLRGITGCVLSGDGEEVEAGVLILHADSEESANRLAERVVPRLLRVAGESAEVLAVEDVVVIGRGEGAVRRALEAREDAERSAGPALRATWGGGEVVRCGAVWPGRWRGLVGEKTARVVVEGAPPVVWWGRRRGEEEVDRIEWGGLKGTVARWVRAVP
jgi:hypothetical protein